MKNLIKLGTAGRFMILLVVLEGFTAGSFAQLVTNGGFESSNPGVISAVSGYSGTVGWFFQSDTGIHPPAVFEIVNDSLNAQEGHQALKVTIDGTDATTYHIQAVQSMVPVKPGTTYNYSIWVKASQRGAQVNVWVDDYNNYSTIYKSSLYSFPTTDWYNIKMQFIPTDTLIRAACQFSYAANTGRSIYIDNLQITDADIAKKPIVVEAESGKVGANFSTITSGSVTYVTTKSTWTSTGNPGDSTRTIKYQVTFPDSGYYNLFARVRVGPDSFNDDSFFYGNGFGTKNDTLNSDWVFVNGLGSGGFSDSSAWVDGAGSVGSNIWKWANVTKNTYSGVPGGVFYVRPDSLTKTFEIASREDGLDIDKIAFGKNWLYYTVGNLDNIQAGSTTMQAKVVDSSLIWKGPALAAGQGKFLGNVPYEPPENTFTNYWTQLTPGNAGKWGSVAGAAADTSKWNWKVLDAQYNYAMTNHLLYKHHNLIWGSQQPSWISGLDSATQNYWIDTWIKKVGQRYPKIDMVDVVNEPLGNPPDGGLPWHSTVPRINYIKALGGTGATGWDWVINSFKLARKYMPNAKLLINDYNIINNDNNTTIYLQIINLLKDRGLIDGIGEQGHSGQLQGIDTVTLIYNLNRLGATGLPVYITEFDMGNQDDAGPPDDNYQTQQYQKYFPPLWRHPAVKGITLWGYTVGTWVVTAYLVNSDGTYRPALKWLADFIKANPTGVDIPTTGVPTAYQLSQNYPNPFNPSTTIRYSITHTTNVMLKVFDMLGREVQTLVNTQQAPGQYSVTLNGQNLGSGVYFYRLNAGTYTETKKLMLLK